MNTKHDTAQPQHGPGYETSDANSVRLLLIGGGLLILVAAVLAIIWGLYAIFASTPATATRPSSAMMRENVIPPEPRLQANPSEDLAAYRKTADSLYTTYGWIDSSTGIARIPVDSAISILSRNPPPSAASPGERADIGKENRQ